MQWLWFKYLNTPSQGSAGSAREGDIAIAMSWFSYSNNSDQHCSPSRWYSLWSDPRTWSPSTRHLSGTWRVPGPGEASSCSRGVTTWRTPPSAPLLTPPPVRPPSGWPPPESSPPAPSWWQLWQHFSLGADFLNCGLRFNNGTTFNFVQDLKIVLMIMYM